MQSVIYLWRANRLNSFYIFCPVGNVLAIRTVFLRLAGGTENIERFQS
jgi:hypothetical protein